MTVRLLILMIILLFNSLSVYSQTQKTGLPEAFIEDKARFEYFKIVAFALFNAELSYRGLDGNWYDNATLDEKREVSDSSFKNIIHDLIYREENGIGIIKVLFRIDGIYIEESVNLKLTIRDTNKFGTRLESLLGPMKYDALNNGDSYKLFRSVFIDELGEIPIADVTLSE